MQSFAIRPAPLPQIPAHDEDRGINEQMAEPWSQERSGPLVEPGPKCSSHGNPQRERDHGGEDVARQVDVEQDHVMGRECQAGEDDGQRRRRQARSWPNTNQRQ